MCVCLTITLMLNPCDVQIDSLTGSNEDTGASGETVENPGESPSIGWIHVDLGAARQAVFINRPRVLLPDTRVLVLDGDQSASRRVDYQFYAPRREQRVTVEAR